MKSSTVTQRGYCFRTRKIHIQIPTYIGRLLNDFGHSLCLPILSPIKKFIRIKLCGLWGEEVKEQIWCPKMHFCFLPYNPSSFLGKVFHKWFAIVTFLGMRESD